MLEQTQIHADDMEAIQKAHDMFSAKVDLNDEAAVLQDKAYSLGFERCRKMTQDRIAELERALHGIVELAEHSDLEFYAVTSIINSALSE